MELESDYSENNSNLVDLLDYSLANIVNALRRILPIAVNT